MGHDHLEDIISSSKEVKRNLVVIFVLTFVFMIVEIVVGLISNSLALLADAGHMFSDVLSLGLSVLALIVALRPKNSTFTFGYNRAEVLAAFVNGLSLILISGLIILEAIERFNEPVSIQAGPMLIAATLGLLVNIYGVFILRGHTENNLNVSSAFYHIMADLLGSLAAIFASIMILVTGMYIWDIIISLVITVLIIISGSKILLKAARILMQSVPMHVNSDEIVAHIENIENVVNIHDLHIWAIDQKQTMLTAHITVPENICQHDRQEVQTAINLALKESFQIHHSTLQIEHADPKAVIENCGCN